jgi:hypothetical protein
VGDGTLVTLEEKLALLLVMAIKRLPSSPPCDGSGTLIWLEQQLAHLLIMAAGRLCHQSSGAPSGDAAAKVFIVRSTR